MNYDQKLELTKRRAYYLVPRKVHEHWPSPWFNSAHFFLDVLAVSHV